MFSFKTLRPKVSSPSARWQDVATVHHLLSGSVSVSSLQQTPFRRGPSRRHACPLRPAAWLGWPSKQAGRPGAAMKRFPCAGDLPCVTRWGAISWATVTVEGEGRSKGKGGRRALPLRRPLL
eukprot:scaffold482_cov247-Pinguiococcus_pyrenoidosus.AAC.29